MDFFFICASSFGQRFYSKRVQGVKHSVIFHCDSTDNTDRKKDAILSASSARSVVGRPSVNLCLFVSIRDYYGWIGGPEKLPVGQALIATETANSEISGRIGSRPLPVSRKKHPP